MDLGALGDPVSDAWAAISDKDRLLLQTQQEITGFENAAKRGPASVASYLKITRDMKGVSQPMSPMVKYALIGGAAYLAYFMFKGKK